jgi:Mg2+ and Co2+ transporter CorA
MRAAVEEVPAANEETHRRTSLRSVHGRFEDLVERQLELFLSESADLLRDCEEALALYNSAPRDEAEERYGDYLDRVETAQDALVEYRDTFRRTLDDDAAEEYESLFNARAQKRLPSLALGLD